MEEAHPVFSIIIPTYNRFKELAVCLHSLTCLDYPRDCFEVIVVGDGGSALPEAVVDGIRQKIDVKLLTQAHAGPAGARNTGAKRARGKFLAFTDDDCIPKADWLKKLAARFAQTPDHLIGGRTLNAMKSNPYSTTSQMIVDIVYSYYNQDPKRARFFASNNLAIPAERFHELGGFDATFRTSEDRELCDRWLHHGYHMTYAPEAIIYHEHILTLGGFLRQHFGYGRGAFRFHKSTRPPRFRPFCPRARILRAFSNCAAQHALPGAREAGTIRHDSARSMAMRQCSGLFLGNEPHQENQKRRFLTQVLLQNIDDSTRSLAVAVWIPARRSFFVLLSVIEQTLNFAHDRIRLRADKLCNAGFDTLRAFGNVAQDQDRFAEGRRLFLNTSGIGQNQVTTAHDPDHIQVFDRRHQMNPFPTTKHLFDR